VRERRFEGTAAGIPRGRERAGRRAVVRAVAGDDLRAARRHPRDLDRVLVRVGAAEREQEPVEARRHGSTASASPALVRIAVDIPGAAAGSSAACRAIASEISGWWSDADAFITSDARSRTLRPFASSKCAPPRRRSRSGRAPL
jgi:hypothetical protein